MLGYEYRETFYKVEGTYRWLTKEELVIAKTLEIEFYPTYHGGLECPTPHICGYQCSTEDWQRISKLKQRSEKNVR